MNAYVFLGPTLPVDEARAIADVHYRPPAAMGDVYSAVERGARLIGIVDGLFEQTPAVWHKEILYALSKGVRVLGSSSMGALRAAELHAFGMEGVGRIFEAFRDGEYEDDDEVTVAHGPADSGYRLLSEAMVNLRLGLRRAEEQGLLSAVNRQRLVQAAKALFYPERSWVAVRDEARRLGLPENEIVALLSFVKSSRPDQKRDDAVELLRKVADESRAGIRPHQPTFEFEPTVFWTHLTSVAKRLLEPGANGTANGSALRLRHHVRANLRDRKDLRRGALLLFLVHAETQRLGLAVPPLSVALARFRRGRGLTSAESMNQWLLRNRSNKEACAELARLELLCDELLARYASEVDDRLTLELQRRGQLGEVTDAVDRKWKQLAERGITDPTPSDAAAPFEDILEWYQSRLEPVYTDLDTHARELGFLSKRELVTELVAEYLVESSPQGAHQGHGD